MHVRCIVASEASFLVCSMARIFYIRIYFRPSICRAVNVLNVSTCIYISAQCDIPQCEYKRATHKRNRLNDLAYKSAAAYVEDAFARQMLASY